MSFRSVCHSDQVHVICRSSCRPFRSVSVCHSRLYVLQVCMSFRSSACHLQIILWTIQICKFFRSVFHSRLYVLQVCMSFTSVCPSHNVHIISMSSRSSSRPFKSKSPNLYILQIRMSFRSVCPSDLYVLQICMSFRSVCPSDLYVLQRHISFTSVHHSDGIQMHKSFENKRMSLKLRTDLSSDHRGARTSI